jgi:hypothetical protein
MKSQTTGNLRSCFYVTLLKIKGLYKKSGYFFSLTLYTKCFNLDILEM